MALSATICRTSSAGTPAKFLAITPIRVRELRLLVREVRCPDQLVDAEQVAQADADAVLLEAPQDVLFEIVGRLLGQRLPAQQFHAAQWRCRS